MSKNHGFHKTKVKDDTVKEYEGGNHIIDKLLDEWYPDHEKIWMVNGAGGRRPIIAPNQEEAVKEYDRRRLQAQGEYLRHSSESAA